MDWGGIPPTQGLFGPLFLALIVGGLGGDWPDAGAGGGGGPLGWVFSLTHFNKLFGGRHRSAGPGPAE